MPSLPQQALVKTLNHLLAQEPWARTRLQPHSGQTVFLDLPGLSIHLQIDGLGYFAVPDLKEGMSEPTPDLTLRIPVNTIWTIAQTWLAGDKQNQSQQQAQGQTLSRAVHMEGDVDLAQTLGYLAQHLRWDAEHDLARVLTSLGPAFSPLAAPLIAALKQIRQHAQNSAQRAQANVVEFFVHEQPTLVAQPALQQLTQQIQQMRERLDRLQKRVEFVEKIAEKKTP